MPGTENGRARRRERAGAGSVRDREADGPDLDALVADADVLAADLLVGGPAREALDVVRNHDWVTLFASDALLDDAEAVIGTLADDGLASDWREVIEPLREPVDHPPGDHPGLASVYRSGAAHLLTFDEALRSAKTGATLVRRFDVSVKHPAAFVRQYDPADRYEQRFGEPNPGPDRDPHG